ncbi:hypothetical protein LCGC14_1356940, partial [marine sediment metagenome]
MAEAPSYPLGEYPNLEPFFESLRRDMQLRRFTQRVPYAASITPDANKGEILIVDTLTGDLTVANPVNARDGMRLYFSFTQDGTGGHTVSFGTDFSTSWETIEDAGATSTVDFFYNAVAGVWVQESDFITAPSGGGLPSVITQLITFDRDPNAPFAVTAGSGVVTSLDSDLLDGQHGTYYRDAGNLNAGTLLNARVAESNVTQHEAALTILESQITDGTILARVAASETITGTYAFNPAAGTPFTTTRTDLVTNLNADLLDSQEGTYYLDSDNFTGTEWADLTDAGGTTLHTHALNNITNPTGNKTFQMTTRTLKFLWTNPNGNPMELEASGAYSGSVLHIHQHTGNPGANTYLVT